MRRIVARIGRAHGVRGEVSIQVRTDAPADRFVPGAVLVLSAPENRSAAGVPEQVTIQRVRNHNGILLLTFAEVSDRGAADAVRDFVLEADVEESTEDDAWYDEQLAGLQAVSPSGEVLGTVVSLELGAAQDRLVVRRPDGQDRLVPFVAQIVPVVDPSAGRVVIDAPPGLINDLINDVDELDRDEP